MLLTDLADAARTSGLKVIEVDGWRTRGHGQMTEIQSIVCHHTATSAKAAGDYPSLRIVRDGRSDLPGPLAQLGLGRDGTVYVIAAGLSYHAGVVYRTSQDNAHAIGIEAEHDGLSPWPAAQVAAYARLCAALVDHYDLVVEDVLGHKEVARPQGRKTDPNFDMPAFRRRVDDVLAQLHQPPPAPPRPGRAEAVAERRRLTALARALRPGRLRDKVKAARDLLPKAKR